MQRRLFPWLTIASLLIASMAARGSAQRLQSAPSDDLGSARQQLQREQPQEAARLLETYLAKHPDSAEAAYLLGYAYYRASKPQRSLEQYTRAAQLRAPSPEDLFTVSVDYILLDDYADAAKWLTSVTSSEPNNSLAWYYLGRSLFSLERYSEATAALSQAMTIQPRYVRAKVAEGLVKEAVGLPDEALSCYHVAQTWDTQKTTHDAQPYLASGMLLLKQGKLAEARAELVTAQSMSHGNPRVLQELGKVDIRLAQYQAAEAELSQAELLAPTSSAVHFLHGTALQRLGKTAEAQAEFAATRRLVGSKDTKETENFDLRGSITH